MKQHSAGQLQVYLLFTKRHFGEKIAKDVNKGV